MSSAPRFAPVSRASPPVEDEGVTVTIEVCLAGTPVGTGAAEVTVPPHATVRDVMEQFLKSRGVDENQVSESWRLLTVYGDCLAFDLSLEEANITPGSTLYLGNKESEASLFGFHNWWLLSFLTIAIGITGVICISTAYIVHTKVPFQYGVVMDAGSTYSFFVVYGWAGSKRNGTGVVERIGEPCVMNASLTELGPNPEAVKAYVGPCVQQMQNLVSSPLLLGSPVFVEGSAGFRLLSSGENSTVALAVLETVRDALFSLGFTDVKVGVLGAANEGIGSWVTLNYVRDTLDHLDAHGKRPRTIGALDITDSSIDISYQSRDFGNPNVTTIRLYGIKFPLYSASYLCYGLNQAHLRYLDDLVQNANGTTVVVGPTGAGGSNTSGVSVLVMPNPCGNSGLTAPVVYRLRDITQSPCTHSEQSPSDEETLLQFNYTWDSQECTKRVKQLLDPAFCRASYGDSYCLPSPESLPPFHTGELSSAIHVLTDVVEDLQLNATTNNREEFERRLNHICGMNWTQLNEAFNKSGNADARFLKELCFQGMLIQTFLIDFLRFDSEESWNNLTFAQKMDEMDLSWTMGFMINATNAIPETSPSPLLDGSMYALLVVLFIGFLFTGTAFLLHAFHMRKNHEGFARMVVPIRPAYGTI
ncbi:unnamed protein product [Cyprideis torosa]|uniref:Uncharacterized protein n=1 Tax=Cyprideis torosa TaxID=163714 RepID=A0A7R8ZJR1_9CRUS|nr:unnamed protein product [Cyprideis torosa]CAG0882863.1 unnamed protein product [Cyprideis torosa]